MFRLQENVPEYLINESRDFQLFCRLYDCLNNGTKFDTDSIVRVMNTTTCGSRFLKLLETRLGFFTDGQYTDTEIRDILMGFCDMVKYKGSILGISRAVRSFLIAKNIKVATIIKYNNIDNQVSIGLRSRNLDTSLLDDMLRYVMPAGCLVDYFYFVEDKRKTNLEYGERVIWIFADDVNTSNLVSKSNTYTDSEDQDAPFRLADDEEKSAIDDKLSNIGFTNLYSVPEQPVSGKDWEVDTVEDTIKENNNI